ncbi:MAG: YIP1 family protein [Caldilineaceae bacterium]
MLQPRAYPELIGKALVLEAEPFMVMVDDDDPWVEGIFLTISLGFLVGVARLIGGVLTAATLPPPDAILATLLQGWRQYSLYLPQQVNPAIGEAALRESWAMAAYWGGYSGGWLRLLTVITTPASFLLQWLVAGALVYAVARLLGGTGALNPTLGATALMVAPNVLRLFEAIPFVAVSQLLLTVWGVLVLYRAVEVAHELPWSRALLAALAPWILLALLAFVISLLVGAGIVMWSQT